MRGEADVVEERDDAGHGVVVPPGRLVGSRVLRVRRGLGFDGNPLVGPGLGAHRELRVRGVLSPPPAGLGRDGSRPPGPQVGPVDAARQDAREHPVRVLGVRARRLRDRAEQQPRPSRGRAELRRPRGEAGVDELVEMRPHRVRVQPDRDGDRLDVEGLRTGAQRFEHGHPAHAGQHAMGLGVDRFAVHGYIFH